MKKQNPETPAKPLQLQLVSNGKIIGCLNLNAREHRRLALVAAENKKDLCGMIRKALTIQCGTGELPLDTGVFIPAILVQEDRCKAERLAAAAYHRHN